MKPKNKIKCVQIIPEGDKANIETEVYIKDILSFKRIHHSGQNGIYLEFSTRHSNFQIRGKDERKFRLKMLEMIKEKGEIKSYFVKTGLGGDGQKLGYKIFWKELINPFI